MRPALIQSTSSGSTATFRPRLHRTLGRPRSRGALAEINDYSHGGHPELKRAIATRHDVSADNVVLGAGSGDLILLCARALLRPGDVAAIVPARTFPLYRIGVLQAGAVIGERSPALTFACRPNNPTGELTDLPVTRPLVVDEAYAEYAGVSAISLIDEGVIVLRTFSKAFGLAAARVGYAIASADIAAELNRWQAPHPISTMSAALAARGACVNPPDVAAQVEERERLATELRGLGFAPLPSFTNFVFVPLEDVSAVADPLLQHGIVVRRYDDGVRINVRDRHDDDLLLRTLATVLEVPWRGTPSAGRTVRHLRATAETSIRVRLALDGNGIVRVSSGRRPLRPPPGAARIPRRH